MIKRVCKILMFALFGVFKSYQGALQPKLGISPIGNKLGGVPQTLSYSLISIKICIKQLCSDVPWVWACFPLNLNCCTALCPAGPLELGLAQMNSCVLLKRRIIIMNMNMTARLFYSSTPSVLYMSKIQLFALLLFTGCPKKYSGLLKQSCT